MFQSVRGMQDCLPSMTPTWEALESHLKAIAKRYGYQEIRFPIVESTELFQRSIGTVTDIVEKEMYHLRDNAKGQSFSLRPEGTASCVRAAIEHQLLATNLPKRLFYLGPMFRRERPQKGRYRQFHQFGIEAFGMNQPDIDAEIIAMTDRLWKELTIHDKVRLQINSLGSYESRNEYRAQLVRYFTEHFEELDDDSKRRLDINPLRILDSKHPNTIELNKKAPTLLECLDEASMNHFITLQNLLKKLNIEFTVNPHLVRGLDYYNRTVFEWVMHSNTGAQNTLCGGGRYDGLVKKLKGPDRAAVGFSIGLERLLDLWMNVQSTPHLEAPHIYIVKAGEKANSEGLAVAEKLRDHLPHLKIQTDCQKDHFSQQLKRANASHAPIALIIGDNEVQTNTIILKHLKAQIPQQTLSLNSLLNYLQHLNLA